MLKKSFLRLYIMFIWPSSHPTHNKLFKSNQKVIENTIHNVFKLAPLPPIAKSIVKGGGATNHGRIPPSPQKNSIRLTVPDGILKK